MPRCVVVRLPALSERLRLPPPASTPQRTAFRGAVLSAVRGYAARPARVVVMPPRFRVQHPDGRLGGPPRRGVAFLGTVPRASAGSPGRAALRRRRPGSPSPRPIRAAGGAASAARDSGTCSTTATGRRRTCRIDARSWTEPMRPGRGLTWRQPIGVDVLRPGLEWQSVHRHRLHRRAFVVALAHSHRPARFDPPIGFAD